MTTAIVRYIYRCYVWRSNCLATNLEFIFSYFMFCFILHRHIAYWYRTCPQVFASLVCFRATWAPLHPPPTDTHTLIITPFNSVLRVYRCNAAASAAAALRFLFLGLGAGSVCHLTAPARICLCHIAILSCWVVSAAWFCHSCSCNSSSSSVAAPCRLPPSVMCSDCWQQYQQQPQ